MKIKASPGGPLRGSVTVPGDKSISHRALMLGAVADGTTRISGFLAGEDTEATLGALVKLGVRVDRPGRTDVVIQGAGADGLRAPGGPLDLGNSGTSARLFAGLLAGQSFDVELRGDASLSRRPMLRVVEPLRRMGAEISCTEAGTLPMRIHGGRVLHGINYDLPVASAQLKSALLLAGLSAEGATCVREPAVTRDHTERMLAQFGCEVTHAGGQVCVRKCQLTACDVQVPGDLSSAAFLIAAATLVPGSDLSIESVGLNPTRDAAISILREMGAAIEVENRRLLGAEPAGDLRVRYAPLRGLRIPSNLVSVAIDEFPMIMVAAAFASGETLLSGAQELRVKESDRIDALQQGLEQLGIRAVARPDGLVVTGGRPGGGRVDSHGDHRIAMAFAVAGLAAGAPVEIHDCANVRTSFPEFTAMLSGLGASIVEEPTA